MKSIFVWFNKTFVSGRHRVDKFLNRFISKKLMVFIISCYFLYIGALGEDNWTIIVCIYLFAQGTYDITTNFLTKRKASKDD